MGGPLPLSWGLTFTDTSIEKSFALVLFNERALQQMVIGVAVIIMQSAGLLTYYLRRNDFDTRLQVAVASSSIALLGAALAATVVCWAVLVLTAAQLHAPPGLGSMATTTRTTMMMTATLVPPVSPRPALTAGTNSGHSQPLLPLPRRLRAQGRLVAAAALPHVEDLIQSGGLSLLWCGALLLAVLEMQTTIVWMCTTSAVGAVSITCATYLLGGYPLLPVCHAFTCAFFLLFVSSKPLYTVGAMSAAWCATATQIYMLYPGVRGIPSRLFLSLSTLGCFVALGVTGVVFSLSMSYSQRRSFYRLHALTSSFEAYDTKVQQLRATEEREARARSALLATMSHEMRTPLSGLIGGLEMLAEDGDLARKLDAGQADLLGISRRCADSLLVIINEILEYRWEAGGFL